MFASQNSLVHPPPFGIFASLGQFSAEKLGNTSPIRSGLSAPQTFHTFALIGQVFTILHLFPCASTPPAPLTAPISPPLHHFVYSLHQSLALNPRTAVFCPLPPPPPPPSLPSHPDGSSHTHMALILFSA
ncbi:unnamed protein product [Protopolystoma xenopodis]|uniref:Uncharacterized protein n=1 Tax=Protopolystoma xenopodis TaxID=117903 RepID=A0A3S5CVG0_9PLAT|nr:unnamed protein product [Protopolystoma xenopodis]